MPPPIVMHGSNWAIPEGKWLIEIRLDPPLGKWEDPLLPFVKSLP